MALVLSGERSSAAAVSNNPVRAVFAWFAKARAGQARRVALTNLLERDNHRLDDLGINRADLFEALRDDQRAKSLAARRAASARNWLNP
ncbi:MAG: hypothetical protein JWP26_782 [Devosia sp.]|nr:hypothetical protein [Devosia sp.]